MKIATLPRALRRPALTPVALALAGLITVAFAALIAASEITVPQQKQDGQPAVNNPNDDLMFKKFGSPLAIDIGDGNERTLYLLEGNSPQDKSDPAHLTYYHDLALALVPRKERLPGYPAWFQTVINRENETVIDVRFRLSSPQLRAAAEAKLLSDERAFFDKKRQELGVPAIKVEVLPVPAYELRLYIQDRASGLTLASAQENIRSWTKDVTLTFRFNKESLATFLNCEKEGTLRFTPYYYPGIQVAHKTVLVVNPIVNISIPPSGAIKRTKGHGYFFARRSAVVR